MTNDALMESAVAKTESANQALRRIHVVGHGQPVPAEMFAEVRRDLSMALTNVFELERRARGGATPAAGGLPDPAEPRNEM